MRHTDVFAINRSSRRSEAQSNVLEPSPATLSDSLRLRCLRASLVVEEDVWLLLERALTLDCQFGGHDCGVEQSVELARSGMVFEPAA